MLRFDLALVVFADRILRADEGLKSAAYISEYVREQPAGIDAPFHLALNEKGSIWDWYDKPSNDLRGRRFNSAMSGGGDMFPPSIFTKGLFLSAVLLVSISILSRFHQPQMCTGST